ncbi:phosphatidylinositol-glycan biosynthesis class W protein [Mycetomoellerius zeteki]|nr:PREDICTED: phosphatidylinositol-glycan biosynthesis class W protein-like [Trachymyrmex zeteki]
MTASVSKEQYRLEQEAFVSNHEGTTPQAVIFTLLPTIFSIILAATTVEVLKKYIYTHKNMRVVVEFMLTIIPTILCCTILSEYIGSVCVIIILVSILNMSLVLLKKSNDLSLNITAEYLNKQPGTDKIPFITNFRALTNIITAICILAVDFHIFPRKFAKTEVFGYSLMDTGVGLFILANALVAPEVRDFSAYRQVSFLQTLTRNMSKCFRSCIPLLILGFGRFAVVEYIGYQKHITEYGVHWNFFITLAIVKLFTSMITSTISSKYSLLSGIWILCMHEYIMNTKDLKTLVLRDEPRDDFFSANREGLISIPGYVGLYFVGVAIGRFIHSTYHLHATSSINFNIKLSLFKVKGYYVGPLSLLNFKLFMISALIYFAILFCNFKISRRLANAGYCLWIVALTTALLSFLVFIQFLLELLNIISWPSDRGNVWIRYKMKMSKNLPVNLKKHVKSEKEENIEDVYRKSLEIFDAVNYNSLFFFLISNIMTGIVNMLMYTLYAKQSVALLILIIYMAVNILSVLILYRLKIPIKL